MLWSIATDVSVFRPPCFLLQICNIDVIFSCLRLCCPKSTGDFAVLTIWKQSHLVPSCTRRRQRVMEQNSEYLAVGTRGLAKAMTPSECALPPCCTPLPSPLNSKNSLELLSSPLNSPIPCRLHHPSSLAIAWPHPSALIPNSWPYPSDSLPSHFLTLPCDW